MLVVLMQCVCYIFGSLSPALCFQVGNLVIGSTCRLPASYLHCYMPSSYNFMSSRKSKNIPEPQEFLPMTCKFAPSGSQSPITHFFKITTIPNRDRLKCLDQSIDSTICTEEDEIAFQEQVDNLHEQMDQRFSQIEDLLRGLSAPVTGVRAMI